VVGDRQVNRRDRDGSVTMANRLRIEKPRSMDRSPYAQLAYGDKVSASILIDGDKVLIEDWASFEPGMGFSRKALKLLRRKFDSIAVADTSTSDPKDPDYKLFTFWMRMLDDGLIDAFNFYDHERNENMWMHIEENPRGGKRKIPRKIKKEYVGTSYELDLPPFDVDHILRHANEVGRHLFMQHLYKRTKRTGFPKAEETAGYWGKSTKETRKRDPMNQDLNVKYFISKTKFGQEIAFFVTPRSGDVLFLFMPMLG